MTQPNVIEYGWRFRTSTNEALARNRFTYWPANTELAQLKDRWSVTDTFTTYLRYEGIPEDYINESIKQEEAIKYGPMVFDLDSQDASTPEANWKLVVFELTKIVKYFESEWYLPSHAIQWFFSGSKGVHGIIEPEVLDIIPHKHLHIIYRRLAELVIEMTGVTTLDLRVYDARRLFRVPLTRHGKTNLFKIPLTLTDTQLLTYNEICQMAQKPITRHCYENVSIHTRTRIMIQLLIKETARIEEQKLKRLREHNTSINVNTEDIPCVQKMLMEGGRQGKRNESAAALASHFRQTGMDIDTTVAIIIDWAQLKCDPPIIDDRELREIENTVRYQFSARGKTYGCPKFKELSGICVPEHCAFKNKYQIHNKEINN